jgi:hypothetical protein
MSAKKRVKKTGLRKENVETAATASEGAAGHR